MAFEIGATYHPNLIINEALLKAKESEDKDIKELAAEPIALEQKPLPDMSDVLGSLMQIQSNSNEWTREQLQKTMSAFEEFKKMTVDNLSILMIENMRLQTSYYDSITRNIEVKASLTESLGAAYDYIKVLERKLALSQVKTARIAIEFLRHSDSMAKHLNVLGPQTGNPVDCITKVNVCLQSVQDFNRVLDQKLASEIALLNEKAQDPEEFKSFLKAIADVESRGLAEDQEFIEDEDSDEELIEQTK